MGIIIVMTSRRPPGPLAPLNPWVPPALNFPVAHLTAQCPYSYLHSCDPPIIHGNLTCDTIFIQHNGLIKIGSGEGGRGVLGRGASGIWGPWGKIKGMGRAEQNSEVWASDKRKDFSRGNSYGEASQLLERG